LLAFLAGAEDADLCVVEALLELDGLPLKLLHFGLESAGLSFGDLLHVVFRLGLLVLGVDEALSVQELLLHVLEVLLEDLMAFEVLGVLLLHFAYGLLLFLDEHVQPLVLLVGELGDLVGVV
jgi:hypothetical protein